MSLLIVSIRLPLGSDVFSTRYEILICIAYTPADVPSLSFLLPVETRTPNCRRRDTSPLPSATK